jgi:hypothetical protein
LTFITVAYQLSRANPDNQPDLFPEKLPLIAPNTAPTRNETTKTDLHSEPDTVAAVVLGIVAELPTRFGPESLAVNLTAGNRSGVAGWLVDSRLGREFEIDDESVRMLIAGLLDRSLLHLTPSRRLVATAEGVSLWQAMK